MLKMLATACYILVGGTYATLKAGLKTSLDMTVIEQAKDVYFDKIMGLINGMTLPDLEDGDGNYMRENSFEIIEDKDHCEFGTDVPKNAILFINRKVSAVARSGHFRYKVAPLVVAEGHAEVDMNTVDIEVGIAFSTRTLKSGHIVPYVESVDVKCNINRFDINIKLFGNLVTDFASMFEVFFVGTVAGLIEETIVLTLSDGVPLIVNTAIGQTNGDFPMLVFPHWYVDWQTPEAAVIETYRASIGIKANLYDNRIGE